MNGRGGSPNPGDLIWQDEPNLASAQGFRPALDPEYG